MKSGVPSASAIAKLDGMPAPGLRSAPIRNGYEGDAVDVQGARRDLCPPEVLRAPDFIRQYVPLHHVVDGLPVVRGKVTALTGIPGHGKTAIATALLVHVVAGKPFAGMDVSRCPALMLCGESPEDFRLRLMASAQEAGVPLEQLADLLVVPATFDIAYEFEYLQRFASAVGGLGLVVVDTSAAFFQGESENDNPDMHRHAVNLRGLTELSGNPAVLSLCHPRLNPTQQTLVPRGGGAFLAEIDANMSAFKTGDSRVELHWCGKIRGPAFDPIPFELVEQKLEVVDSKGRQVTTIAARAIGIELATRLDADRESEERAVRHALYALPGASFADLAAQSQIKDRFKVGRIVKRLVADGSVEKVSGSYHLSSKGTRAVRGEAG